MKKSLFLVVIIPVLLFALGIAPRAVAEEYRQDYYDTSAESGAEFLSPEELDDLLAPIALYPDPLIAQVLPAATFIEQIEDAADYVRRYGRSRVDYQPWDYSVRAVAHYPTVLYMMSDYYDWTVALGQAYIEQPDEVMDAVQRLRSYARAEGNLYSTPQQEVLYDGPVIRIVPASPEYIYVPVYDPQVIYVERYRPSYPLITFTSGFIIGAWLNRDCDWRDRRVYYHGWRGRGWVARSRPHIRDRRDIYINRRAAVINVNQRVVQRDTRVYRERLRADTVERREPRRFAPLRRVEPNRSARTVRPIPRREMRPGAPAVKPQRAPREQGPSTGVRPPKATGTRPIEQPPREQRQRPGAERGGAPAAAPVIEKAPTAAPQPPPAAGRTPAATGQPPTATGREQREEKQGAGERTRRRVPRPINRPQVPEQPHVAAPEPKASQPPVTAPAPKAQQPTTIVVPTHKAPPVQAPGIEAPQKPVERRERGIERPAERGTERPAERVIERPAERPGEREIERPGGRPEVERGPGIERGRSEGVPRGPRGER